METVKDRVKHYVKYKRMTVRDFERSIGASNGLVSSMRKGLGGEYILRISEQYPELNIEWLLTGRGEMIKPEVETKQSAHIIANNNRHSIITSNSNASFVGSAVGKSGGFSFNGELSDKGGGVSLREQLDELRESLIYERSQVGFFREQFKMAQEQLLNSQRALTISQEQLIRAQDISKGLQEQLAVEKRHTERASEQITELLKMLKEKG